MSSASCLTVVSNFPPPHLTFIGFCAVLDRTRWHVSQFRHGDDQIPSGGSFRAVPQQHSIFDLRDARGVRGQAKPSGSATTTQNRSRVPILISL